MNSAWEVVIGLEIHTQLATVSKIFSGASTKYGAAPNTQACLVDLGYPGVLPVLNAEVVRMACKFGLAVNATVASRCVFARKNYFYPDLPKGYQISQYELPIVHHGELIIKGDKGEDKRVGITRAHLEEDAGKSIHEGLDRSSGIDLNRAHIYGPYDPLSTRLQLLMDRTVHIFWTIAPIWTVRSIYSGRKLL